MENCNVGGVAGQKNLRNLYNINAQVTLFSPVWSQEEGGGEHNSIVLQAHTNVCAVHLLQNADG